MVMKKYKHAIITDEKGKPMVWNNSDEQLTYCTNEDWRDEPNPVRAYTVLKAKALIKKTIANRISWKMSEGVYKIMPFETINL